MRHLLVGIFSLDSCRIRETCFHRRSAILKSLEERNLLTPELKKKVEAAATLATLEDVFAPFRPKRQTRATKAIERGLTPLADWLLENQNADPADEAAKFIDAEKEVPTASDALAGARDIIAESVVLDRSGKLLHHTVLHATAGSNNQLYEAAVELTTLVKKT